MKVKQIADLLQATFLCGEDKGDMDILCGCGSDMMSDVLAFTKHDAMLLTGLTNINTIRTAEMVDIQCIMFVRGKKPMQELIDMANEHKMALLTTEMPMFTACGILYQNDIKGGMRGD